MLTEKRAITWQDIDSQNALELPSRETPATVVVGCLAVCVGQISIRNVSVDVAAQICAAVDVLRISLLSINGTSITCTIRQ